MNGSAWPGQPPASRISRLYRNEGGGHVHRHDEAGRARRSSCTGWARRPPTTTTTAGRTSCITAVGQNRLFRNGGKGTFVDVTDQAGLGGRDGFSTSALWFDYDRDGWLDLLVCNYVKWTPETDVFCSVDGKQKSYCTPEAYRGTTSWLFRNKGNGTFEDATAKAGLFDATSKSLGVTLIDYDQDVWPDLFIANDTQPNKLYRNNGNGTFTELGLQAGLAFSEEGRARAGMGVDAADVDNTGRVSVVVTNFSGEMLGLYRPVGAGQYADVSPRSEIGSATRNTLGFGCFFFDVDLDGLQDLLVVNGHIDDTIGTVQARVTYAEPPHLFTERRQRPVRGRRGAAWEAPSAQPKVGRGAAFGDFDGDSDPDVVITTNGGPVFLYRNDVAQREPRDPPDPAAAPHRTATRSARRCASTAGGQRYTKIVKTGSSYLSQSELPLSFGLGARASADRVQIEWPSGARQELTALAAGVAYEIVEGQGIATTDAARAVNPYVASAFRRKHITSAANVHCPLPAEAGSHGMHHPELIIDAHAVLGEGPLWHTGRQRLIWVDIEGHDLHISDPGTGADERRHVAEHIGCAVSAGDELLVLGLRSGLAVFDLTTGRRAHIEHPEQHLPDNRFNDGKCDPAGRMWAGTMALDEREGAGALYLPASGSDRPADGAARVRLERPRLVARSPDDVLRGQPDEADRGVQYDRATGAIAGERVVFRVPEGAGFPDGMTIDAEGQLWLALWDGRRVVRVDPHAGRVVDQIEMPVSRPTSCAFGGPDLDELFITSASNLPPEQRAREPHAGGVFRVRCGVQGLPAVDFGGTAERSCWTLAHEKESIRGFRLQPEDRRDICLIHLLSLIVAALAAHSPPHPVRSKRERQPPPSGREPRWPDRPWHCCRSAASSRAAGCGVSCRSRPTASRDTSTRSGRMSVRTARGSAARAKAGSAARTSWTASCHSRTCSTIRSSRRGRRSGSTGRSRTRTPMGASGRRRTPTGGPTW